MEKVLQPVELLQFNMEKRYPTPAEFADQAAAQAHADKYAKTLCHEDYLGAWYWVVTAAPV